MRLIDADAADVERICCYYGDNCRIEDVQEWLDEQPAIDAVPVVHARWIEPCINKYGHPCHHCSACRFKASQKDRNYCPNCGAMMRGETDEE